MRYEKHFTLLEILKTRKTPVMFSTTNSNDELIGAIHDLVVDGRQIAGEKYYHGYVVLHLFEEEYKGGAILLQPTDPPEYAYIDFESITTVYTKDHLAVVPKAVEVEAVQEEVKQPGITFGSNSISVSIVGPDGTVTPVTQKLTFRSVEEVKPEPSDALAEALKSVLERASTEEGRGENAH